MIIDLVLCCIVCGGGGDNLEQEAFQYFSGAELNKKWHSLPPPCKGRTTIWFNFISYKFTKFAQSTLMWMGASYIKKIHKADRPTHMHTQGRQTNTHAHTRETDQHTCTHKADRPTHMYTQGRPTDTHAHTRQIDRHMHTQGRPTDTHAHIRQTDRHTCTHNRVGTSGKIV